MASKNDDDNDLLEDKKEDRISVDCAIHYVLNKTYHCELEKDKKRSVRKRAATLVLEDGEVFVSRRTGKSRWLGAEKISCFLSRLAILTQHLVILVWRHGEDQCSLFFMSDTTVHYFKFIVNRFFCMYWPGIYYSLFKTDTVTWGSKFCQGGPNFLYKSSGGNKFSGK